VSDHGPRTSIDLDLIGRLGANQGRRRKPRVFWVALEYRPDAGVPAPGLNGFIDGGKAFLREAFERRLWVGVLGDSAGWSGGGIDSGRRSLGQEG